MEAVKKCLHAFFILMIAFEFGESKEEYDVISHECVTCWDECKGREMVTRMTKFICAEKCFCTGNDTLGIATHVLYPLCEPNVECQYQDEEDGEDDEDEDAAAAHGDDDDADDKSGRRKRCRNCYEKCGEIKISKCKAVCDINQCPCSTNDYSCMQIRICKPDAMGKGKPGKNGGTRCHADTSSENDSKLKYSDIAYILVGVGLIVIVALLVLIILCLVLKRRTKETNDNQTNNTSNVINCNGSTLDVNRISEYQEAEYAYIRDKDLSANNANLQRDSRLSVVNVYTEVDESDHKTPNPSASTTPTYAVPLKKRQHRNVKELVVLPDDYSLAGPCVLPTPESQLDGAKNETNPIITITEMSKASSGFVQKDEPEFTAEDNDTAETRSAEIDHGKTNPKTSLEVIKMKANCVYIEQEEDEQQQFVTNTVYASGEDITRSKNATYFEGEEVVFDENDVYNKD